MLVWGISMDLANTNLKEPSVLKKNYTCLHNLAHQNITLFQNEKKNVGEGLNFNMCIVYICPKNNKNVFQYTTLFLFIGYTIYT